MRIVKGGESFEKKTRSGACTGKVRRVSKDFTSWALSSLCVRETWNLVSPPRHDHITLQKGPLLFHMNCGLIYPERELQWAWISGGLFALHLSPKGLIPESGYGHCLSDRVCGDLSQGQNIVFMLVLALSD